MSESCSSPSLDLSREMVFVNTYVDMPKILARQEFIKHCIRYKCLVCCVRTEYLSNTCRKYTQVPVLITKYDQGKSITGTIYPTPSQGYVVDVRNGISLTGCRIPIVLRFLWYDRDTCKRYVKSCTTIVARLYFLTYKMYF
jgi:hypothetical protein